MDRHRYTPEEVAFLRNNLHGRSYAEMTTLFNQRFGLRLRLGQICKAGQRYGLRNDRDTRLKPGSTAGESTRYIKGQSSLRKKPIGSERLMPDGYTDVKIADPSKWKRKHIFVYESMYGPVPKGHAVLFGDGDKQNFAPHNLVLVSRQELAVMNRRGLVGGSAELTRTGKLVADVSLAIADRRKEGSNGTDQNQPARNREPETDSRRKTGAGG